MSQRRLLSTTVVAVALVFGAAIDRPAQASIVLQAGDFTTHIQAWWGDPTFPSGMLLNAHYDDVYASTASVLVVGLLGSAGYSMAFQSAAAVHYYLPALGPIGPLTGDIVDPSQLTAAGVFGGEMVSLALNIDFSDAGYLPGAAGIAFGDLLLAEFTGDLALLNGMTMRQFFAQGNMLLGGGTSAIDLPSYFEVAQRINASFEDGSTAEQTYPPAVSAWAQDHLRIGAGPPTPVPAPATGALLTLGLVCLAWQRRHSLARAPVCTSTPEVAC
jgi:hypothetical protein